MKLSPKLAKLDAEIVSPLLLPLFLLALIAWLV